MTVVPRLSAAFLTLCCSLWLLSLSTADEATPALRPVQAPPTELQLPEFYSKYISADGYPIVASAHVSDYALREAAWLVDLLLSQRPDIRQAMVRSGSRLCVIGHQEFTTDLPEFAWLGDPAADGQQAEGVSARDFWDARARGTGGSATDPYCSCGEENLLGYPGDPYKAECILIHEFAHNIHLRGMATVDPTFDDRVRLAWQNATSRGLWAGKYAAVNHHEYFAEGVQSWFDNNREDDHDHNHVNTREELLDYDPALADLCREVFRDTELRYTRPETRLTGHLAGFDPASSPEFRWPDRLTQARQKIRASAEQRSRKASPDQKR